MAGRRRGGRLEAGPPLGVRVVVATLLSAAAVFEAAGVAARIGQSGGPDLVYTFVVAAGLTVLLTLAATIAWAWVRRSPDRHPTRLPRDPTGELDRGADRFDVSDEPEAPRHQGLFGDKRPPQRW